MEFNRPPVVNRVNYTAAPYSERQRKTLH